MKKSTEYVICELCGSDDTILLFVENGFNTVKCKKCGLIYLNPRLTKASALKLYSKAYFNNEIQTNRAVIPKNQVKRLVYILRKLTLAPGDKILEIGCGLGFFLKLATDHGLKAQGVEISSFAATYGRQNFNVNIYNGELDGFQCEDRSFSAIVMFDLLSHLYNPRVFLKRIYRLLKEDGFLVMRVGDKTGFFEKFNQKRWSAPEHVYHFTYRTLSRILKESGFSVIAYDPAFDSGFPYLPNCSSNKWLRYMFIVVNKILNKIFMSIRFMDDHFIIAKKIADENLLCCK